MGNERVFKTSPLTDVNRHILDVARDSISAEQDWEFFCECGRPDCEERIALSLAATKPCTTPVGRSLPTVTG